MTATAERVADAGANQEAVPVRRTAEQVVSVLAMVAATSFLGGFTAVMNGLEEATFAESGLPAMLGLQELSSADSYHLASTLAAWFGFTLIAVLLLSAAGLLTLRRRPRRRDTGWWFLAAGLVCLFGSQLILYPVAFIFFVSAGLLALRPVAPRSVS
ncbi:hypothetical protein [Pseudactinotalea terrae]|uniref:hypothetical protein n=1 Tax=Pseudactinotalea terrae TaxID=1743262 RepID=UPI0012E2233D|nr:hypothetical protein [Pseudactinotalea terrae]